MDMFQDNKLEDIPNTKPFANEHACRLEDPMKYIRFRRKNCYRQAYGKCVDYIFGKKQNGKVELQALRYDKSIWSIEDARKNCKENAGDFEPAQEEDIF